ncbi:hypothetical protein [Pontibacter liquoris]|uniref:hypothetical protein n=1 Tax=Pontibacter liquoris TaxID=2905677 RepID=UPI001FA6F498|nr:hypothetical protein [Pontibacter liquoris]
MEGSSSIEFYDDGLLSESSEYGENRLTVEYLEQSHTLQVIWEGSVSSEEVRQGYKQVMELVQAHKPTKWLLDLHKRELIRREDQRWVFTHVFSKALQCICQNVFVAIILPVYSFHSLVNELSGDELMQEDNFMIIHHFLYEQEAQRWLLQMEEMNLKV